MFEELLWFVFLFTTSTCLCAQSQRATLFSWVLWSFWAHSAVTASSPYLQTYLIFTDRAEVVFCPQVSLCVAHLHMCAHACVQKSPSLMNHWCRGHVLLLIYSVSPILVLFETIAQKHWMLLCFVLSSSVFFPLSSFLLFGCWIGVYPFLWGWLFRPSYVAVALGVPPHVQGHMERRRRPRCPTALMLPDSCIQEGRSEQEPVSLLCFYFWLCCEK